jgi:putative transposase
MLWTVLRKDQYEMDGDRIVLKWLGAIGWIEARCKGPIYLRGERGELEIHYGADNPKPRKWVGVMGRRPGPGLNSQEGGM